MATAECNSHRETLSEEFAWLADHAKAPRLRSMLEWAEQEIILPNGPHQGERYRIANQPYARHYLEAADDPRWQIINATGPSQSGKTMTCSVIPLLYHLFEIQETVIFGLPDLDMAGDKWTEDIEPVIAQTRYKDLIPRRGSGSKGGNTLRRKFLNGVTMRFMTGGGGDKSRSAFTSRVVVITETDGMDKASEKSREADKIAQLIARTKAFGRRRRIYMECTVTTEEGRTWREYKSGTESRIMLRCPRCEAFVFPERQHLTGWQGAADEVEAHDLSAFACPECAEPWSDEDRRAANRDSILLHRGQSIEDGQIVGEIPRTFTLGFRWSAPNNLFVEPGDVGAAEWKRARAENEENAEKELLQFIWAMPYKPPQIEMIHLTARAIMARQTTTKRGFVPQWVNLLTLGCDIGARAAHWIVKGWGESAKSHIVDYGVIEIHSDEFGIDRAILMALRSFRDEVMAAGWDGRTVEMAAFDSGYQKNPVREFTEESGEGFIASIGYGSATRNPYHQPRSNQGSVRLIGDHYYIDLDSEGRQVLNVDADYYKSFGAERLAVPVDDATATTIFQAEHPNEHLAFAKHMTAERRIEEFKVGKGVVIRWEVKSRNNHWKDADALSCVAGHMAGVRIIELQSENPQETTLAKWFGERR